MRRRVNLRTAIENAVVIGVAGFAVLLIANFISFLSTRALLPPDSKIGDVDISGLTIDDAISKTVTALNQPVTLSHLDNTRQMQPAEVDFRLNDAIVRLQLQPMVDRQQGLDHFPGFVIRQYGAPAQLSTPYQYSEAKLQAYMEVLRGQFDKQPQTTTPDLSTQQVQKSQDGTALNVAEASQSVLAALSSSSKRTVELPVDVIPAGETNIRELEAQVAARLQAFAEVEGNIAAVFIKDLASGDELAMNADVAVSAQGWLKMAVMAETVRASALPLTQTLRDQLVAVSAQGSNSAANDALRTIGDGDVQRGADMLNATLNKIGLRNTFLAQPFDWGTPPPNIVTPANARGDISAVPEANAQSTVADAGVMLASLFDCSNGQGGMLLALADSISKEKCAAVLDLMGQNTAAGLLRDGSGKSTVFHRQSWSAADQGDAALIQSPGRTYVIAIVLHGKEALNVADTSAIITDIARLVYGFYNGQLPPTMPPLSVPPGP